MDDDSLLRRIDELERYLASDDEMPSEELIVDSGELMDQHENEDMAPAILPESRDDV